MSNMNAILKAATDLHRERSNPKAFGSALEHLEGYMPLRRACKAAIDGGCDPDAVHKLLKGAMGGDGMAGTDLSTMPPEMQPEMDEEMGDDTIGGAEDRPVMKSMGDAFDGDDSLLAACEEMTHAYGLKPGEDWEQALQETGDPVKAGQIVAQPGAAGSHEVIEEKIQDGIDRPMAKAMGAPKAPSYPQQRQAAMTHSSWAQGATKAAIHAGTPEVHAQAMRVHRQAAAMHTAAAAKAPAEVKADHTTLAAHHEKAANFHEIRAGKVAAGAAAPKPSGSGSGMHAGVRPAVKAQVKAHTRQEGGKVVQVHAYSTAKAGTHHKLSTEHLTRHDMDWKGGGRGYLGHENRNAGTDKALVEAAQHHGFDDDQIEAYAKSRSGRHNMDALSFHKAYPKPSEGVADDEVAYAKHRATAYDAIPHEDKVEHFKKALGKVKGQQDFKEHTEEIRHSKADEPSMEADHYAQREWKRHGHEATNASVAAREATRKAQHEDRTPESHEAASKAHEEAAKIHRAKGDRKILGINKSIADFHDEAAAAHKGMAAKGKA